MCLCNSTLLLDLGLDDDERAPDVGGGGLKNQWPDPVVVHHGNYRSIFSLISFLFIKYLPEKFMKNLTKGASFGIKNRNESIKFQEKNINWGKVVEENVRKMFYLKIVLYNPMTTRLRPGTTLAVVLVMEPKKLSNDEAATLIVC